MSPIVPPGSDKGLPGPIAENFGAFEPRFYGISFLLGTPSMFRGWLAKTGLFADTDGPALPLFEDTCLQTALEHERRHFHDALISPFANVIFMLRIMATTNGMKLFNRAMRSGANCLPIPVKTWMGMNHHERTAWLERISDELPSGLTPPLRPLPLPHLDRGAFRETPPGLYNVDSDNPEAEIHAFANPTIAAYMDVADLMHGAAVSLRTDPIFKSYSEEEKRLCEAILTPRNVFEASALAVQIQAAWTNIGEDAANSVGKYLLTSDLGYAKAFRRIALSSAPSNKPGMMDPLRVSAVAVYCLLGDPDVRDHLDPALRLSRLLRHLDQCRGIAATEPVAALWDEWDAHFGYKSWRKSLQQMRGRTERSLAMYATASQRPWEDQASVVATVLEAYRADQIVATDLLLNDPDSYVNTHRYIEETQNTLPVPILSVELGNDFVAPVEEFPTADAVRLPRILDKDGVRGWNRSVVDLHHPPRPKLLDAVLDLEFTCKLCDVAFSEEALSPIDSATLLESIVRVSGMVPLFVF